MLSLMSSPIIRLEHFLQVAMMMTVSRLSTLGANTCCRLNARSCRVSVAARWLSCHQNLRNWFASGMPRRKQSKQVFAVTIDDG